MNRYHLVQEIDAIKLTLGSMKATQDDAGLASFVTKAIGIARTEGIPEHFAAQLEKILEEDYLLERAKEEVRMERHGDDRFHWMFIPQKQRFLKVDACRGVMDGLREYLETDESFRLHGNIQAFMSSLEEAVKDKGVQWRRWVTFMVLFFEKKQKRFSKGEKKQ